ncbi:MAG: glycosyltransferase family 4 protein, partial [Cyanobacteria bacterium P01_A01_bin.137]
STALKQAILTLAQSPQLRHQLGQAAQATVHQQLSPQIEQKNWAAVYGQVLTPQDFRTSVPLLF